MHSRHAAIESSEFGGHSKIRYCTSKSGLSALHSDLFISGTRTTDWIKDLNCTITCLTDATASVSTKSHVFC